MKRIDSDELSWFLPGFLHGCRNPPQCSGFGPNLWGWVANPAWLWNSHSRGTNQKGTEGGLGLGGGYLRKWNWDLQLIGNGYQPDWLSDLRQGDGFTPPIIGAHARQRTKHGSRQNWFGPILNCFSNVPRSIKPSLVSISSGHIFHRFTKLSQCSWKYNLCACSPISSWFYQAKNMKVILI